MRLMPAQYVKPYVKTNKNDYIDAEACSEAVTRPTMRFVPIKSDDQLDLQSLHRVRERWVVRRTAVINQIRGMLLERGITIRKGRHHIEESLPGILEDPDNKLSGALRVLLTQLRSEMQYLHGQIDETDKLIARICGELERQTPGRDPWNRTDHCYGHGGSHRQRCSLQEGPRILCLAGSGARRALHRWQAKADRYQQTRKQIPAETVRARGTHRTAAENKAIFRTEYVAGQSHITQAPASRDRGTS